MEKLITERGNILSAKEKEETVESAGPDER